MINQFGSGSHRGHLGVASPLLWFARERLGKLWGLTAAQRRDKKEDISLLVQNHSLPTERPTETLRRGGVRERRRD